MLPKQNQTACAVIFTIIDGISYLMVTIYFWQISKEWTWIVLVGYIFNVIGAILSWFLPESPSYLMSLDRYDELIAMFKRIAKYNKASDQFTMTSDELAQAL